MSENEDVPLRDEIGTEEEEVEDSSGIEEEESGEGDDSLQKAKQAITCRNVTLNTLMDDGIIESGKSVLSIDYLGQRFEADLLPNGKIKWQGSEVEFGTPSAWALHCKRLVNPVKRSGCGWASVKYKNKKLDIWKSIWARKHRTSSPFKSPHCSPGQSISQFSPPQSTFATPMNISPGSDPEKVVATSTPIKNTPPSSIRPEEGAPVSKSLALSPVSATATTTASETSPQLLSSTSSPSANISVVLSGQTTLSETKADPVKTDQENSRKNVACEEGLGASHQQNLSSSKLFGSPPKAGQQLEASLDSSQSNLESPTKTTPLKRPDASSWTKDNHRNSVEIVLKDRKCVSYTNLGIRRADIDLNTLIRCENFESHSKLQPFTVSLTTNAALLMDFHCHLTRSEVVGYLGGRWDPHRQHLSIEQSFPVLCRLGDKFKAPLVEDEIRRRMKTRKMSLAGWYHSHPYCLPQPSIRDIDSQMSYQLKMRGNGTTYHPCIGFIEAPYEKAGEDKNDSFLQAFWVMPNLEHPSCFNIPMHVSYSLQRDLSLTEDILIDMRRLTEFYSGAPDRVRFKERWKDSVTYLDKIRSSLANKLPEDQLDSGTFLDYMQQLVRDMK